MQLDCGELIQRRVAQGVFEPDSLAFAARILREGSVFVDAGANVGIYTAMAAKRVGGAGRVVAFEPAAAAFSKLESMVLANDLHQVRAFRIALDRTDGEVELFVPPPAYGNLNASLFEYASGMVPERIMAKRLDGVLEGLGIPKVDLLKVDVEGKERDVLLGARGYLKTGLVEWVLMELNERLLQLAGTSAGEVVSLLAGFGYRQRRALDDLNWVFERALRD
jgi:FkbM family methyltransferase